MILPPGTTIEPLEDTIYCQMYAQGNKWRQGSKLIIPDTAKEEVFFARVLAVGPGRTIDLDTDRLPIRKPMFVSPGDDVVFQRYHGERIEIEGGFYVLMRQDDVLSKIKVPMEHDGFFKLAESGSDVNEEALAGAKA